MIANRFWQIIFKSLNLPLRLLLILFFILSALNLQPAATVKADLAGTALQFNGSNQYVTFGDTRMVNGTLAGSPTWNTAANSKFGASSLTFNGSSQYVTTGTGTTLNSPTFTVEIWFYRTGAGTGVTTGTSGIASAVPLLTKGTSEGETSTADINYFLGIDATTAVLVADFEEAASGSSPSLNHPISGTTAIALNTWYHAAATYDGNKWQIFLNGNLEGELVVGRPANAAVISPAALGTSIRSNGTTIQGYFAGRLDEARIWNYARSQSDIQGSMNSEILVPTTGLIGRWGLNDGSGTTAANLNRLGVTSFTLEAWVNRLSEGASMTTGSGGLDGAGGRPQASPVLAKGMGEGETPANVNTNWFLGITTDGFVGADFEDNAGGINHPAWGTTSIAIGSGWHHIAATYSGACWALYVDGIADPLNTSAVTCPNATPESTSYQRAAISAGINSTGGLGTGYFSGMIDEARVWNRALSQTEIYDNRYLELTSGTGLIARWGLNEATGTSTASSVGTFSGTLTNSPTWVTGFPDNTPPGAPTNLTATGVAGAVDLFWTAPSDTDIAGYYIYRSTTSPVELTTPINGSPVSGTTYSDMTAGAGTTYYYASRSLDTSGNLSVSVSNEASAAPLVAPLITVTSAISPFSSVAGSPSAEQSYTVSGSNLTADITITPPTDFELSLVSGSGFSTAPLTLTQSSGSVSATPIYVRLNRASAGTSSGNIAHTSSGATTQNLAVSGTAYVTPAAPTGLTATATNQARITLNWTDNSTDESGFEIERSTTGLGGTYTLLTTAAANAVTYPDNSVTPEMEYCYRVRAVNFAGGSAYAGPICATTPSTALQFDGTTQYIAFGNPAGIGVQTFTLECWVNWTGGGATANTGSGGVNAIPLIAKGLHESDGSTVDANFFLGITSTGQLAADFEEYGGGQNYPITGTGTLPSNSWHHVAVTYDGQTWKLYMDGLLDSSLTLAAPHTPRYDSIQKLGIAAAMDSATTVEGRYAGKMDEVRIWNYARSQAEIYSTINSKITSAGGLVARWGLDEGSGSTVNSSVGAFPGTLTNGPSWVTPGSPFNIVLDTNPPAAPSGLTAVGANASALLDWNDNTEPDLAGYNVYRATVSSGPWTKVNSSLVLVSTYSDTGLTNGTEYFYVVRAVDTSLNESLDSNETYTYPMADQGAALEFTSATGTYVTFGDPAKLDLSAFTLETWFKRTGTGTPNTTGTDGIANAVPLVTHGAPEADGSNVDANWMLVLDNATNVIAADFEDNATGGNHPVLGVTPVTMNVWHHAAATYDGTTWKLYLDGKLETTLAVGAAPRSDTTQRAALGTMLTSTGAANGAFQGALDETRIWNRALTQTEILTNINQQITSGNGLVARWGLNEGGGTAIGDSITSPAAANGNITGSNFAWVPGALFNLNLTPNVPTLVAPADAATGVSTPPTLTVHVTDSINNGLTVSFYGRPKVGTPGPDFSLIAIPDPQYYASAYPSIYNDQMNWVVANKSSRNIPFVLSLGDNVNTSSQASEWTNAAAAWDILTTGGVPYGLTLGNHDGAPSATANFNTTFGTRIAGQSTFGGRYGSSDYDNTYSLFSAGGMDFIVLFIEYDDSMTSTSHPVLTWANTILAANPTRRAIAVTHNLLSGNNFTGQGQAIYDALKGNANLFMLLGGHLDTTGQRSDTYNGHTVYSMRSDYQFIDSQQSGYLRILRFSPTDNRIYITTYSTNQAKYLTDASNQFSLSYTMASAPSYALIGTASVQSGQDASVSWSGLASGTEYEWYAVSSNGAASATSSIWSFTTAAPSNLAPVITEADPISVTMSEDGSPTPFSMSIHATDANIGDTLTWSLLSGASHGTATVNGTGASPTVTYIPTLNYNGADSFAVQVSDGNGGTDSITVNVTIQPVNDAPTDITLNNSTIAENQPANTVVGTLSTTDPDAGQTFTYSLVAGSGDTGNGSFNINGAELRATNPLNFEAQSSYSVRIQSMDQGGLTYEKIFTITVTDVNEAPTNISLSNSSVNENAPTGTAVGALSSTDPDAANTFTYTLVSGDMTAFSITGSSLLTNAVFDFETKSSYSVTVRTTDQGGLSFDKAFTITVINVNEAPVCQPVTLVTDEDTPGTTAPSCTDPEANTLTYAIASQGAKGTATVVGGLLRYAPSLNLNGADSFTYTASDGLLTSIAATVNVTINPVNDAPIITGQNTVTMSEDTSRTIVLGDLLVTDVDNTYPIGFTLNVSAGANYSLAGNTITPALNFNGELTVPVTVSDGSGGTSNSFDLIVSVDPVNDAPVCNAVTLTVTAQTPGAVAPNCTDIDGDTLTYSIVGQPSHGAAAVVSNQLQFTASAGYSGPDSFTYKANDGLVDSNVANASVTVNALHSIALVPGWNLVSFRLVPLSNQLADVLSSVAGNYDLVYAWDASVSSNNWLRADNVPATTDTLLTLNPEQGFWIHMTAADTLDIIGSEPSSTTIPLRITAGGWNLVGYPSPTARDLPGALSDNGLGSNYYLVFAYHAANGSPWLMNEQGKPIYANDLTQMTPGWGYWIKVNTAASWSVAR